MKNDFLTGNMDLDIYLENQDEVRNLRNSSLEGELKEKGKLLGKKLILKHKDFEHLGDGIEVKIIKSDPEGGWDEITAFEVIINNHAYPHLQQHNRTGSHYGLGSKITIYGPRYFENFILDRF